jgi:hypothetical protein
LDGQLAACGKCTKVNDEASNKADRVFLGQFLKYAPTPAVGVAAVGLLFSVIGVEVGRYQSLRECADGVCNPQSMSPAPSATPATEVETGAPICPGGTHDCGVSPGLTTHYCCFGTDVCCNGTCCIADVGCACAAG